MKTKGGMKGVNGGFRERGEFRERNSEGIKKKNEEIGSKWKKNP